MGCCASSSKVVAHRSPHADESDRKPAKRDKPPCGKPPEAKQEAKDERKDEHEGTADQASCKETENRTEPPGMVHMEATGSCCKTLLYTFRPLINVLCQSSMSIAWLVRSFTLKVQRRGGHGA
ncbi:unnamed protein product, partial [Effrenium voratum]